VLHTALRNMNSEPIILDGTDIMPEINRVFDKMRKFAESIRSGQHLGYDGSPIRTIVNIGIGGSDLGPRMAYEGLRYYSDRDLRFRFISNVDPADFYEQTRDLNPAETLFIVASKSFTTQETINNATLAREWLAEKTDDPAAVSKHFVALSTNTEAVKAFGIDPENMFEFWDFVGGRYSLLSAIGLSVMIAVGPEKFDELRSGAHAMDRHFRAAPFHENIPALLALLGIWYRDCFGMQTEAVFPYSHYLSHLPAYLQQLVMESNGKSVTLDGKPVSYDTSPIIWGTVGTNSQHAFFQMLHQGTTTAPIDLLGFETPLKDFDGQHRTLLANLHAQVEAFAFGRDKAQLQAKGVVEDLIPHKQIPGNRPVNVITADQLTPFSLGQIIALYEHKTFVQGQIWNINSFDQFGVELGKEKALELLTS